MGKLTERDRQVLMFLDMYKPGSVRPGRLASDANIRTSSPRETAARHLIRLTRLGYAERTGTRMFPEWRITDAGRLALSQMEKNDD